MSSMYPPRITYQTRENGAIYTDVTLYFSACVQERRRFCEPLSRAELIVSCVWICARIRTRRLPKKRYIGIITYFFWRQGLTLSRLGKRLLSVLQYFTSDLCTIICIRTQCCPTQHARQSDSE